MRTEALNVRLAEQPYLSKVTALLVWIENPDRVMMNTLKNEVLEGANQILTLVTAPAA